MNTETVEIKITGPEGSGKTVVIQLLQHLLLKAGVATTVEHVSHTLSFRRLTYQQVSNLLKPANFE